MFPTLQSDIDARFEAVRSFFRATQGFQGDLAAAAKGITFVQVYAVYEFTVRSSVQIAIDAINAHATPMKDLSPTLLALYLDPELTGLRDCGIRNIWKHRMTIFERAFSNSPVSVANGTGPPNDGSHYRATNLSMIFDVFGIRRMPVRRKEHLMRINEVVDHRNQIAHGSETAEEVGRRYSRKEIAHRIDQMQSVCSLLIAVFHDYCADSSRHRRR